MKRITSFILVIIFLLTFAGCVNSESTETVVIKKPEVIKEKKDKDSGYLDYKVNKIYNDKGIVSWLDDSDRVVRILNDISNNSIKALNYDYKSKFNEELLKVESSEVGFCSTSPNGKNIIYSIRDGGKEQYFIKIVDENYSVQLDAPNIKYIPGNSISWSRDSRYISFATGLYSDEAYIYDCQEYKLKKIGVLKGEVYLNTHISPSGSFAITQGMNYQKNKYFSSAASEDKKKVINTDGFVFDVFFISDNEAIILDGDKLYLLSNINGEMKRKDISNNKSFARVGISKDGKIIAFSNKGASEDLYIGKITEEGVVDEKLVYKSSTVFTEIHFNDAANKVLLTNANFWYISNIDTNSTIIEFI